MNLKKLLWNDKAEALADTLLTPERREAMRAAAEKHGPALRKSGRVAFAGAKVVAAALGTVGAALLNAYANSANSDEEKDDCNPIASFDFDLIEDGRHGGGPEGPGYYVNGFKVDRDWSDR